MNPAEFIYCVLLRPRLLRKTANGLLRAVIPRETRVRGATVRLNPADPVISGALRFGVYEQDEIRYFCDHFKPGMTFVDVGANVGLYTALAIRNGAARILAVEPHPEALSFLGQTIESNHPSCPVHVEACAAGRARGNLVLYSNRDNKGDNRLHPHPMLEERTEVPVETLDTLCTKHHIHKIDFLKVDVQGAEMLVFEGASEIFRQSPGCTIMTEFWPEGLRASGSDPEAFLRLLSSQGRRISQLQNGRVLPAEPAELMARAVGRQYLNLVVTPAPAGT